MLTSRSRLRVVLGGLAPGGVTADVEVSAAAWPFARHILPETSGGRIWIRDLHLAFPRGQAAGTRLVLTQSTYQLQRCLDWLEARPGATAIASGSPAILGEEASGRRGPWSRIDAVAGVAMGDSPASETTELYRAFAQPDARVRLGVCSRAIAGAPADAALLLAFASACMELQLLDDAATALERARGMASDWEAVHFEAGKLWLRREETERAARAFAEAARLMPTFAAAWSNLGAALGELGQAAEALAALRRARAMDPFGYPTINNIGAAYREAGRLGDAERAFREVIAIAPGFIFGHYNLAHTLFLQGRFDEARLGYEEAFARDPQKNARQACRLAVARAAAGDPEGAMQLMVEVKAGVPEERLGELFDEAESTLNALAAVPGIDAAALGRVRAALRSYSS